MRFEALNKPEMRHRIDKQMAEIASDPIGAFQQISDVLVAMTEEIAALNERVSVLEGQRTVNSTQ